MSRYQLRLTPAARADLKAVAKYSVKTHGLRTAEAYDSLIKQTFTLLRDDPFRPGSADRSEIVEGMRSYHIGLTKISSPSPIQSPRHLVFYAVPKKDILIISRVLHDARDFTRSMVEIRNDVMEKAISPEKTTSRKREREE